MIFFFGLATWRFTVHSLNSDRSNSDWVASFVGIVIASAVIWLSVKQYKNEGRRDDWFFWPAFGPVHLHSVDALRMATAMDAVADSYVDLCVASIELETARSSPRRKRVVNEQDHQRGAREAADMASSKLITIAEECLGKAYREAQAFVADLEHELRRLKQASPSRPEIHSAMDSISHQCKERLRLVESQIPRPSTPQTSDDQPAQSPE